MDRKEKLFSSVMDESAVVCCHHFQHCRLLWDAHLELFLSQERFDWKKNFLASSSFLENEENEITRSKHWEQLVDVNRFQMKCWIDSKINHWRKLTHWKGGREREKEKRERADNRNSVAYFFRCMKKIIFFSLKQEQKENLDLKHNPSWIRSWCKFFPRLFSLPTMEIQFQGRNSIGW